MGKRREDKPETVPPVDLDAIQDAQWSPQGDFDSWCSRQDDQFDTYVRGTG
jgi:hypothetical protein